MAHRKHNPEKGNIHSPFLKVTQRAKAVLQQRNLHTFAKFWHYGVIRCVGTQYLHYWSGDCRYLLIVSVSNNDFITTLTLTDVIVLPRGA